MTLTGILRRVMQGRDKQRLTRFHDEGGNRVPWKNLDHAPLAFATTIARVLFDWRLAQPWIAFEATQQIDRLLRPDATVLEFGSGMSTIWLAKRCRAMVSIEHEPFWYQRVACLLKRERTHNVTYLLRDEDAYCDLETLPSTWTRANFDFVLIDGIRRAECAQAALHRVKDGGYLYLDNADRRSSSDYQQAKHLLQAAADEADVRYYIDFAPGSFVVMQGMLVRIQNEARRVGRDAGERESIGVRG